MDHCEACGFVYDEVALSSVPGLLRSFGPRYGSRLRDEPADRLRARPDADTWSALEYACHVRDVFEVQDERLHEALTTDVPAFTSMDREGRVVRDRYNEQEPAEVARQLDAAAQVIASSFEALTPEQWARTGIYHWPTREERAMAWLARHTIHEGEHHLLDLDASLAMSEAPRGS
jgi:hypothetical protein